MPLTFIFSQGLVELEMGLEPTTYGLQDRCATNCATPAHAQDSSLSLVSTLSHDNESYNTSGLSAKQDREHELYPSPT